MRIYRLSIKIEPELRQRLKARAYLNNKTIAEVLTDFIREYVKD